MSKSLQNLSNFVGQIGLKRVLFAALLVRLILAIPFRSGDLDHYAIWGIYAREFGFSGFYDFLNFGNYARPDYPPLASVLFWFVRAVWEGIFAIFWRINLAIPAFPSNFITWLDHEGYLYLLKLPGLFADFGIGLVLYWYTQKKLDKNKALLVAALYLFSPATIYISSMWGQVDGLVILLGLLAFLWFEQKKTTRGFLAFAASVLIKPTMLMITPVLFYFLFLTNKPFKNLIRGVLVSGIFAVGTAYLFAPWNPTFWLVENYLNKFLKGAVILPLPYIQLRAYNFWTLLTGWELVTGDVVFMGLRISTWAFMIFVTLAFLLTIFIFKYKKPWETAVLLIFISFLFLPGVHERYLLPIIPFLVILCVGSSRRLWLFIVLSILYFVNLYGAWQTPASFISELLQIDWIARAGSFIMLILFFYTVYMFISGVRPLKK